MSDEMSGRSKLPGPERQFTRMLQCHVTPEIADGFKRLAAVTHSRSSDHQRRAMVNYLMNCGVLSLPTIPRQLDHVDGA